MITRYFAAGAAFGVAFRPGEARAAHKSNTPRHSRADPRFACADTGACPVKR